jgi:hypothetical protein
MKRFIEVVVFWKVLAGKKRIFSAILLAFFMLLAKQSERNCLLPACRTGRGLI